MLALTLLSHRSNGSSHLRFSVGDFLKCPISLSHSLLFFLLFAAESILIDTIINVFQTHVPHNVIRCVKKKESMCTQLCFGNTMFNSVKHACLLQDSLESLIYTGNLQMRNSVYSVF